MDQPGTTKPIVSIDVAPRSERLRLFGGIAYLLVVALVFAKDLYSLAVHSAGNELHSHILLIPFITAYLLHIQRTSLPRTYHSSFIGAALFACGGIATALFAHQLNGNSSLSENDYLSIIALAVILFVIAGGFLFLGARWMKRAIFPAAFLLFAIPMPDGMANTLENWSKLGSAETASWFFTLSGEPVIREARVFFQLPGITLEVAQECSGIRSSWVLLITSVLASYLFLRSPWRRILLVLCVIPLGLLRNGFRVFVIGSLCVYISPDMINSVIHHRGGPIFFVLSLIPLFLLLWWFRKKDRPAPAVSVKN